MVAFWQGTDFQNCLQHVSSLPDLNFGSIRQRLEERRNLIMTAHTKQLEQAVSCGDLCQLLSVAFRPPTEELAQSLADGSYLLDGIDILRELALEETSILSIKEDFASLALNQLKTDQCYQSMKQEYTRLFLHPGQPAVPIYETLFRKDEMEESDLGCTLFTSPLALDAEYCYKQAGVVLTEELREPADHFATELEFMVYLFCEEIKHLQHQDVGALEAVRNRQIEFWGNHLSKWSVDFCQAVAEQALQPAYSWIGKFGALALPWLGSLVDRKTS
jgi:TorA maturation chaperone TorD